MEQGASLRVMVDIMNALSVARVVNGTPTDFQGRDTNYSGVLAQPMSIHFAHLLERGKRSWYPGSDMDWAADAEQIRSREEHALKTRLSALGQWYGIKLGPEPKAFDPWHRLAFALAEAHVPGLAVGRELGAKLPGKGAPPVLNSGQIGSFGKLVHEAVNAGMRDDGTIARLVLEKGYFQVPNRKAKNRSNPGDKPLPSRTARHLVRQMRQAWKAVVNGKATSFQFAVVHLALISDRFHDASPPDWGVVFGLRANFGAD
jgi:hypothetical protein